MADGPGSIKRGIDKVQPGSRHHVDEKERSAWSGKGVTDPRRRILATKGDACERGNLEPRGKVEKNRKKSGIETEVTDASRKTVGKLTPTSLQILHRRTAGV